MDTCHWNNERTFLLNDGMPYIACLNISSYFVLVHYQWLLAAWMMDPFGSFGSLDSAETKARAPILHTAAVSTVCLKFSNHYKETKNLVGCVTISDNTTNNHYQYKFFSHEPLSSKSLHTILLEQSLVITWLLSDTSFAFVNCYWLL